MSGVIPPFVVCVALVTYRAVAGKTTIQPPLAAAPLPATYVATAAAYSVLGIMDHAIGNRTNLAVLLGWGFDLAIFLNLFGRGQATSTTQGGTGPVGAAALQTQSAQTAFATQAALGAPATH